MFHKRNHLPSRKRHQGNTMDNQLSARPRNKFWFVFFILFFLWYLLLYVFDWTSLPGLSSVAHQQQGPLESYGSGTIGPAPVVPQSKNVTIVNNVNHTSKDVSRNAIVDDHKDQSEAANVSSLENEAIEDLEELEKELEPLLQKDQEQENRASEKRKTLPKDQEAQENRASEKRKTLPKDQEEQENRASEKGKTLPKDQEEQENRASEKRKTSPKEQEQENRAYEKRKTLPKDQEEQENRAYEKRKRRRPCTGRYIYMHNLPTRFNDDYVRQCKALNKWHDMCKYYLNSGLGPRIGNPQRILSRSGWYATDQFSLEVIFHHRMKQYECLTNDSSKAAAIYVPFYPGLDVSRYLWENYSVSVRDADSLELCKWLRGKPEWDRMNGMDHFVVTARITWDMRRVRDEGVASKWGNKLMLLPESQNMTMLTIESSPWDKNDFAVPYPTYFHPSSEDEITQWQNKVRKQRRKVLYCFVGAPRPNMNGSIRGEIMEQCIASRKKCKMIECKDTRNNCLKPASVMRMFQNSIFCLQPSGDSFTRRSTFDAILAGCIPVFFTPASAYVQYLWHLPKDHGSYSVLIPEGDVKQKKLSIDSVLSGISKAKVSAMREEVIKLIPNIIYPRTRLDTVDDAFDLAVKGIIERVDGLKREIAEGRNSSAEFDAESSWKYYTFGTTEKHEWDHYFVRTDS